MGSLAVNIQQVDKSLPGDFHRAQTDQMFGVNLAINYPKTPFQQMIHGEGEGRLGGIRDPVKHRLSEKNLPDGNPVQSAHQLAVLPAFK